jgi:hypothetical protein
MSTALATALNDATGGTLGFTVAFSITTGTFQIAATGFFALDTAVGALTRPFDYGLSYYLGFNKGVRDSVAVSGLYLLDSDFYANLTGDNYLFLRVNDYNCVRHNTGDTEVLALAKLLLVDGKNYVTFDNYAGEHAKEVVFPAPQNLARLHIQVLDAYGMPVELKTVNFSFSMEVLEIKNSTLYNTIRDSMGTNYL